MTVEIVTFGCRLNAYESAVMQANAEAAGTDGVVIVNTCAVTAEAERQARQAVRKLRRERPDVQIVVTGCAAQIAPERWAAMPEVDRVVGNADKLKPGAFALDGPRVAVGDIMAVRETASHLVAGAAGRARAFVEVQQGCDHRCTFCVIPFGRGPSRSVPVGAVVERARTLVDQGFREIVLTGVDLTAWGADLPGAPALGQLVRRLLALVPDLPRLRLSSLDPAEIDDDLWRLIADEPRLMPHLHLSLQAGDDLILKRMKRRHSRAQAIASADRARRLRPEIVLGADLIAGFPTEDAAMFRNSLDLVADAGLVWLHVFPYSPRPDTPAARMPQVPGPEIRARAAALRAAGAAAVRRYLASRIGTRATVLVERDGRGHDDHYAPVAIEGGAGAEGHLVAAEITAATDDTLLARAA